MISGARRHRARGTAAGRQIAERCGGAETAPPQGERVRRVSCERAFFPRKSRAKSDSKAGLLASGSSYWPHLPATPGQAVEACRAWRSGLLAAFVPGYSGWNRNGVAPFSLFFSRSDKPARHPVSLARTLPEASRLSSGVDTTRERRVTCACRGPRRPCGTNQSSAGTERHRAIDSRRSGRSRGRDGPPE